MVESIKLLINSSPLMVSSISLHFHTYLSTMASLNDIINTSLKLVFHSLHMYLYLILIGIMSFLLLSILLTIYPHPLSNFHLHMRSSLAHHQTIPNFKPLVVFTTHGFVLIHLTNLIIILLYLSFLVTHSKCLPLS